MRTLDAQGVAARKAKKFNVVRHAFVSAGVNACWSLDGHDKLNQYGLALYMIVEEDSQVVVRLQVWKSNKNPEVPVELYLSAVEEFSCMSAFLSDALTRR